MSKLELYSHCSTQARKAVASRDPAQIEDIYSLVQRAVKDKRITGRRATQLRGVARALKKARATAGRIANESFLDDAFWLLQCASAARKQFDKCGCAVFEEAQRHIDASVMIVENLSPEIAHLLSRSIQAYRREKNFQQHKLDLDRLKNVRSRQK